jgi:hypothetical protein
MGGGTGSWPGGFGRWARCALAAGLGGFALAAFSLAPTASAGTISVTNLNDSGPGSLRAAITEAAANETIALPAGQITLTSGPLAFSKNLTISGDGASSSVISGNNASRVFTITGTPTVTLRELTVTRGNNPKGGGISASGTLTLDGVVVSANHAGGGGAEGSGGGIEFIGAGALSLTESSVTENTAGGGTLGTGFGGGIEYLPTANLQSFTLTLTRSSVSRNRAGGGGTESAGFGGGIDASPGTEGGSVTIDVNESSVSENTAGGGGTEAEGFGGGLELSSGGKNNTLTLSIDHSAVTGNTAGGGGTKASGIGGGLGFASGGAGVEQTLTIANSTVSANGAGGAGTAANGSGGGVLFGIGTANLSHVTVANNSAGGSGGTASGGGLSLQSVGSGGIGNSIVAANSGGNCATAVPSAGDNVDDGMTCGFSGAGDKSATDAKLGPLGEHGGATLTQMPLAGSPAIDGGDAATCPPSDQRGVSRPQGGGCDIGAVEVQSPSATTSSTVSGLGTESATVGGNVNPNFSQTSYHVDYGTSTTYGSFTAVASAGEGGARQAVSATLTKLQPATLYHFRVVAVNAAGTSVGGDQTFTTIRTSAAVPTLFSVPIKSPSLSSASLTNRRFRVGKKSTAISARKVPVGTSFRFRLSALARVQITITRSAKGLRRGRGCVAPTSKLKQAHAKGCTRTLTVGKLTRSNLRAGTNAIVFSGRIGKRALSPGTYKALLSASNVGGRSRPVALSFTVVR